MATTATFTKTGNKAATAVKLDKAIFEVELKSHELIKQAYDAYLSNGRENLAITKTRGLVSGGGRKPWRQKGTGRARFGSSRNPIWRGGGIAFGPTGNENYTKNLNIKAKRLALKQALSMANSENRIKIIETFECKDGKVAETAKLLKKIEAKGNVLIVVSLLDDKVRRATNNLPNVKSVHGDYLNVYDLVNADTIIISQKALESITERLNKETK